LSALESLRRSALIDASSATLELVEALAEPALAADEAADAGDTESSRAFKARIEAAISACCALAAALAVSLLC